jgi:ubiquinone/menaquinone biosynthesis C-methylase UbiE/pimeloyl-ACP methyl ester carboxylesterase
VATLHSLASQSLRKLHRGAIQSPDAVHALLQEALRQGVELRNGVDHKSRPRVARLIEVNGYSITLDAQNIEAARRPQIFFQFDIRSTRYFFASPPLGSDELGHLRLKSPAAIYESERRDLPRFSLSGSEPPRPIALFAATSAQAKGWIQNWSYQGLCVSVENEPEVLRANQLEVVFEDERGSEQRLFAIVRRLETAAPRPGWTTLGLEVSAVPPAEPFPVERREKILEEGRIQRAWKRVAIAGAMATWLPAARRFAKKREPEIEKVTYRNRSDQDICALVDRTGPKARGTVVVVPPAWGRTKESFLALARTLVATFEKAGEAITVLRFDGTNRRGESFIDEGCRGAGNEYLKFRFSGAVEDITASVEFAQKEFSPKRTIVVAFSLGAVEARRAIALDQGASIDGWVSVVGMVDLQSGLRTVSGGVDFALGQSLGVEFGRHELVGVVADMDRTGRDAFEHGLVLFEDAKRDMARIDLPITWIHGRFDSWMDLDRVRDLMAAGPAAKRKLIEIPSGHQMRSSWEALETFQLISKEVSRIALDRDLPPVTPDVVDLDRRTRAERNRRPKVELDNREFWSDYLLGRDRSFGFELMSATSEYRELMNAQIELLGLQSGQLVLDLGGGVGDFSVRLADEFKDLELRIAHLDLVPDALVRSRRRVNATGHRGLSIARVAADLDLSEGLALPLREGSVDAVLASLFLSYLERPMELLRGIAAVLRPGGRVVLSSMRRDADISRIYVNALAELPPDRRQVHFGPESAKQLEQIQRVFLNDAAKLVQLEEEGRFRFYDTEDLESMIRAAGLIPEKSQLAFGSPPQAVIVRAIRPRSA